MKRELYFIISIIIFIIAAAVIIVPTLRFQAKQQKLSTPLKVLTAPIPEIEKPITVKEIITPEIEKSTAAAAEPAEAKTKTKIVAEVKNKPLTQARNAAKGWVVMVPVTSKQQETTVMTTFHAQGLSPFVVSREQKRIAYIGPVASESTADEIAAQLPAFGLMQADVQPFVPEDFVAKISN